MAFRFSALIVLAALCAGSHAFVPSSSQGSAARGTALHMKSANRDEKERRTAAAFLTAAYLMANTMSVAPAFAAFFEDPGTTQVIAARSGGRAGGRASSGGAKANYNTNRQIQERKEAASSYSSSPAYSGAAGGGTTTIITPPVYSSPMYAPAPAYSSPGPDMTGLGLSVGLSAVSSIGTAIRENRQENEIRESRKELTEARIKEAELEARLRALENAPRAQ